MARSRSSQSQQLTLSLFDKADLGDARVNPETVRGGLRDVPAQTMEPTREAQVFDLLEQMVAPPNMRAALKRVEQNKGASGVDGMTVDKLRPFLTAQWITLRSAILEGNYRPQPVRRVEIPKPGGGVRLLGIPTVLDRLIQQALLQILTPIFDPHFSPASYGFRPGKRGHDAVRQAHEYVCSGHDWVVDLDLEKFFDRVNHDILMARVARSVSDKRVLRLIRRFLESGVMVNGLVGPTEEGTPQGGPLSPLLSNIVLDDLDKELTRRGHKFVRYADDCNIYVGSQRAGERVKASVTAFLEDRLRLKVNNAKSAVDRPWARKFLGFTFYSKDKRIIMATASLQKVKAKIQSLTQRSAAVSMSERIRELNQFLGGWMGYFALSEFSATFRTLDQWIRHRLRMCQWKQWKLTRTRIRKLRSLGISESEVREAAFCRKGYWRIAQLEPLHKALTIAYWQSKGFVALADRYQRIRNVWRTAVCGPACTVV